SLVELACTNRVAEHVPDTEAPSRRRDCQCHTPRRRVAVDLSSLRIGCRDVLQLRRVVRSIRTLKRYSAQALVDAAQLIVAIQSASLAHARLIGYQWPRRELWVARPGKQTQQY